MGVLRVAAKEEGTLKKPGLMMSLLAALCLVALPMAFAEGEGKTLYDKKCAMCHGRDGVAKKLAAGSGNFNDPKWQSENTVDDIIKVTTEGRDKMKPYEGKLTAEQIRMVTEYIKTMK